MICRPAGKWPCRMERVAVSHTAAATCKHRDGGGEAGDGERIGVAAAGGTINRENVLRKLKCWLDVNTASQAGNAIFAEKDGGTALLW